MDWYEDEFYPLVERAIEEAFKGRYLFNCYLYLKGNKATKPQVRKFCESSTAVELSETTLELEQYIKGGDSTLREAYGHIPKPTARKIKTYLYKILEDDDDKIFKWFSEIDNNNYIKKNDVSDFLKNFKL